MREQNLLTMKTMKLLSKTFSCIIVMFFIGNITAQELEVSPGKLIFNANPGSSQTQQVSVRNRASKEQSFIFNLGDWLTDEKGETKYFKPGTIPRSCADWITVSPSLITLQPNESAKINVTMLVPNDNSSTKWAVMFVESAVEQTGPQAVDKGMKMGMTLSARIAIPIFQSPSSNNFYKATIEGLTESVQDSTRVYNTKVINLGDKILNCKVYFTFSNLVTADEITSDPIEFSLLPESNKDVKYTLSQPLEKGKYSVAAVLDYGHSDELEGVQIDIDVK